MRSRTSKRFQCINCGAYTMATGSAAAAAQLRATCIRQEPIHRPMVHVDVQMDPFRDQADLERFFPELEQTT